VDNFGLCYGLNVDERELFDALGAVHGAEDYVAVVFCDLDDLGDSGD